MSLNATIFPPLDHPTIAVDFCRLVLEPDGSPPELLAKRMGLYVELLDAHLAAAPAWDAERRYVVGHSFGGMLAMAWWLAHGGMGPARVDGMVLCSTTAGRLFDVASLGLGIRLPISPFMGLWSAPRVTRMVKRLFSGRVDRVEDVDFRALRNTSDTAIDSAGWRNTDWRAMRSFRFALEGFDVRTRLAEIDVPVIVLHGGRDPLLPPALGRALADGLPRATLWPIKHAGHGLPVTHGEEIRRALDYLGAR